MKKEKHLFELIDSALVLIKDDNTRAILEEIKEAAKVEIQENRIEERIKQIERSRKILKLFSKCNDVYDIANLSNKLTKIFNFREEILSEKS